VTVGAAGGPVIVTLVVVPGLVQVPLIWKAVYGPVTVTVIEAVVSPVDHDNVLLPVAVAVNTLWKSQKSFFTTAGAAGAD